MYDATNSTHVTELHDEVMLNVAHYPDPGNTSDVLDKLNNRTSDPAICRQPANSTTRLYTGDDLLAAVVTDSTEYGNVVTRGWDGGAAGDPTEDADRATTRQNLMNDIITRGETIIDRRFQNQVLITFSAANAPNINAAIVAIMTGPQSQGEVLWGDDTEITRAEWIEARDSQGGFQVATMDATEAQAWLDEINAKDPDRIRRMLMKHPDLSALEYAMTKESRSAAGTWR